MKKIALTFLTACLVFAAGCHFVGIRGNGHIKTAERTVSAFANIHVAGGFEIEWQTGAPSLHITTDENLLSYIDSDVSNTTFCWPTRTNPRQTVGFRVVVSCPGRPVARISGAVKLTAPQLTGRRFALESGGA